MPKKTAAEKKAAKEARKRARRERELKKKLKKGELTEEEYAKATAKTTETKSTKAKKTTYVIFYRISHSHLFTYIYPLFLVTHAIMHAYVTLEPQDEGCVGARSGNWKVIIVGTFSRYSYRFVFHHTFRT